jgi:hypothetical protein
LFGTHYGVDLFTNESELVDSLSTNIETNMNANYSSMSSLNYIDGSNENVLADTYVQKVYDYRIDRYVHTQTKYTTDDFDSENNLCRELLLQLIEHDPVRFQDIQATDKPQQLPFIVGDAINFKIGIHASEGQELLTGVAPIPVRTYQIKIVLKNTPYKTIPMPETTAIVNYIQASPFPRLQFINFNDLEMFDFILFKFSIYLQSEEINNVNSYVTGMMQIYPKAFNGNITFPFSNVINGNSNYQIDSSHNRMFYIQNMENVNLAADLLSITVNASSGEFVFNINTPNTLHLQVELQNNGKLPIQYISSKNFDINFI